MGKLQRQFCNFLFLIKALLAIVLGCGALGIQGYLVYTKYQNGKFYFLA